MEHPSDNDREQESPSRDQTGSLRSSPRGKPESAVVGALSALPGTLAPGTIVANRYRIATLLGRGGMGEVYRADDLTLGMPVALKFVPGWLNRSKRRLELLRAEVRLARRVSHPNVCRVHDIGESGGHYFLSMELVEGEDLASLLRRIGRLPYEKAMEIARQLCSALAALHGQGLVHRDLKPSNVMIDATGRAKIADFGLAILDNQSHATELAGTPAYMSPEQIHGRAATVRSDIYSLGLVLYELFTGVRVHDVATPDELEKLVNSGGKPRRLSDHLERAEEQLDEAISHCLEVDPIDRPSSSLAVLALLPGGDPLRAVLEAEQTPSPELVAASGPAVRLAPWTAALLLAGAVACLPIETIIKYVHGEHHAINLEKSPEVLVDRAKNFLRTLGYTRSSRDHITVCNFRTLQSTLALHSVMANARLGTRPADTLMRELLGRSHPAPFSMTYIEDPVNIPYDEDIEVANLALLSEPFSVAIAVTQAGDLLSERAIAPLRLAGTNAAPEILDRDLLAMAGLDPTVFQPVPADFRPMGVSSDTRTAWLGSYAGLPNFPIRAEIARMKGWVVAFQLVQDTPTAAAPAPAGPRTSDSNEDAAIAAGRALYALAYVLFAAAAILMAYRQWRSGRGDLRGARRLAASVFTLSLFAWLLLTHHVPSIWGELGPFKNGLGRAAANALIAFALYLAAEPLIRRYAPTLIVSWSRLLAGRWRDGAVGRDVLIGLGFASLYKLSELAWKTDWADPFRLASGLRSVPSAREMASVAFTAGNMASQISDSIVEASITLLGAIAIIKFCRWRPLGIMVATILMAVASRLVFGYFGDSLTANLAASCFAALTMLAALRFGLLALVVSFAAAYLLNPTPATIDPSDWFFPSFAVTALVILAAGLIGFRLATSAPRRRTSTPAS